MSFFRRLQVGVPVFEDEDTARIAWLLNAISLTILGVSIVYCLLVLFILPQPERALPVIAVAWPILFSVLILVRRGRVSIASFFFVITFWLYFTVLEYYLGGVSSTLLILQVITVIFAALLLGGPAALVVTALTVLASGVMAYMEMQGLLPTPFLTMTPLTNWLAYTAIYAVIGALLFFAMRGLQDALERARRSEELMRSINESAPDNIIKVDLDGAILFINRTVPDFTVEEVVGTSIFNYVSEAFHFTMRACFDRVIETGKPDQYEVDYHTKDGQIIFFESRVGPVMRDGEVTALTIISSDITERRQAAAERERLIGELEAKNAELERFTYTVSHDLKTPLVTIKGFLGLLKQDALAGDADRVEGDIAHIDNAAEKMGHLLGDLLELSRIGRQMNLPEKVNLSDLASEAASLVAGQITARGVGVEIEPSMPVVQGDRVRLLEVYQNLLDNAVKFMGDQTAPRIEVGAQQRDGAVLCYVRDNGVGIDPKYHEKVFGLFNRLDLDGEGTGIGLALVRRIVKVHGGKIWVESEGRGRGTTVYFTVPRRVM